MKKKIKTIDDLAEEKYKWLNGCFFELPEGWKQSFGLQMCEDLDQILREGNYENKYKALQIKEKFAELTWYGSEIPSSIAEKYEQWEKKYQDLSRETCQVCGKKGKIEGISGWLIAICPKCKEDMNNF